MRVLSTILFVLLGSNLAMGSEPIRRGDTPLITAAKNGHLEAVRLLLEQGAYVDQADNYGWTPLYLVAVFGSRDLAELLIAAGADVNKADNDGRTPLSLAAYWGKTAVAELLITAGATE